MDCVNIEVCLIVKRRLVFALERYIKYVIRLCKVVTFEMESNVIPGNLLNYQFYLISAFNFSLNNPEGFRTAKKLARAGKRVLLLFTYVPDDFPEEGDFWLTLPWKTPLSKKIEQVLKSPPPSEEDFERLERLWPLLEYKPSNHHHRVE